jgi:hypothetical protein
MKIKIIIIYIVLSIIIWILINKYEDYINEPYITVVGLAGLCNKLQVLLSYLYKANKEGKKLRLYWDITKECPDKFNNLFESIPNVDIQYIENKGWEPNNYSDYQNWDKENENYIKDNYYSLLKPIPSIQNEIDLTKKELGNEYIACHIRKTDALTHHWYKDYIKSDKDYIDFINKYPKDLKIYIATDCRDTQKIFIDKYGDRMIYKKIEDNDNLRQTSLQDAVKDIYVCVGAKYFMRSFGSFSDTIIYLRELN